MSHRTSVRRKQRVRKNLRSQGKPRLSVFISNAHICTNC